jgi:DNA integrity scanning protein DisA with diadenylate cyclase activity
MKPQKLSDQFATLFQMGCQLAQAFEADAILLMLDGPVDWGEIRKRAGSLKLLVAGDQEEPLAGADANGIHIIASNITEGPIYDRLTQALLAGVARDLLVPGAEVVAVYSGFEAGEIDSLSFIRLDEHLGRLTARDLRQLESVVPLTTLKTVVDLAVEIGREGREGKPVGTMFVVGDTRKVLASSRPTGFDPVRGYSRGERNLQDGRVREGIKEIAQMDGAFIVSVDGTVEAACRLVDVAAASVTLSKGLGTRHWAAAAITRKTKAVAVVVSQSNGTVRLFQNGVVVLRIEPFRRAMKWRDFEAEPPASATEPPR